MSGFGFRVLSSGFWVRQLHSPGGATTFEVRRLDRIGQPLLNVFARYLHAIDDDLQERSIDYCPDVDVVERDRATVDEQARKTLLAQRFDVCGNRRRVQRTRSTYAPGN